MHIEAHYHNLSHKPKEHHRMVRTNQIDIWSNGKNFFHFHAKRFHDKYHIEESLVWDKDFH